MLAVPIKFGHGSDFRNAVRSRVDAYLAASGLRVRAPAAMYRKSGILLCWLLTSYVGLVFLSNAWWQAAILSISLALAMAGVGFNISHDASHGSYSAHPAVNRMMAFAFDLLGASSYVWHWKHNILHHGFTNIAGADDDIHLGAMGRLAPSQKHHAFHRFQHYYLWGLYGLTMLKWQLMDDFRNVISGKIGAARVPRPKGGELVLFVLGKLSWFMLFFGFPLLFHSVGTVIAGYLVVNVVLGVIIATVFQTAHTVQEAAFVVPSAGGPVGCIQSEWAAHQVESTVDYAPKSKFLTWYLGGLNFQVEHHLFPKVSHIHYPAIAPIVKQTCHELGVKYSTHPTFRAAIASHYRWLREMSRPPAAIAA